MFRGPKTSEPHGPYMGRLDIRSPLSMTLEPKYSVMKMRIIYGSVVSQIGARRCQVRNIITATLGRAWAVSTLYKSTASATPSRQH